MRMTSMLAGGAAATILLASSAMALPPGFKVKADRLLAAAYAADGPGASVAISEHGKIVYVGTRGLANVAAKKPITPHSVFRIGSITKQFASAVVLQLSAEGKLKLSDPLSRYLPTYPNGAAITVAELLNHTSGIQSYTNIPGWMTEANFAHAYTTDQMIAVFKDLPAPSKPGQAWSYNNSGYFLVGALIEKVTGKPWYQAVDERIVKPLGLTMRYGGDEPRIAAMATGYSEDDHGVALAKHIDMSVPGAAGALDGTPSDLARWGYALHHGMVVAAPYYAQMIAPTKLPDGSVKPYGFGLENGTLRGQPTIGHSGGIPGFSTDSLCVPAEELFVAVYANSDQPKTSPESIVRRLAALAIGKPFPTFTATKLDAAAMKPLLGVYQFKDAKRTLFERDGKYFTRRDDGPESEVFAAKGNRFFYGGDELTWFAVIKNAAGKMIYQRHNNGEDEIDPGTWIGPVPATPAAVAVAPATLASYVGPYTAAIGKVAIAKSANGGLTIQLTGQPPFPLRPTSDNNFMVDQVGAKVTFIVEGGKAVRLDIVQGGQTLPATRD